MKVMAFLDEIGQPDRPLEQAFKYLKESQLLPPGMVSNYLSYNRTSRVSQWNSIIKIKENKKEVKSLRYNVKTKGPVRANKNDNFNSYPLNKYRSNSISLWFSFSFGFSFSFALWSVVKTLCTFLANEKQTKTNRKLYMRIFPALSAFCM